MFVIDKTLHFAFIEASREALLALALAAFNLDFCLPTDLRTPADVLMPKSTPSLAVLTGTLFFLSSSAIRWVVLLVGTNVDLLEIVKFRSSKPWAKSWANMEVVLRRSSCVSSTIVFDTSSTWT